MTRMLICANEDLNEGLYDKLSEMHMNEILEEDAHNAIELVRNNTEYSLIYMIDSKHLHLDTETKHLLLYGMAFRDNWHNDGVSIIIEDGNDSKVYVC